MKMKNKRVQSKFVWVAPEKRKSRFGGSMPPRKPELRKPLLWITRDGRELFLVNVTGESLRLVTASTGGFITCDEDVGTIENNFSYRYENVLPDEAVKIEEYDDYYDLDYVLQTAVIIESESLGCIELRTPAEKGGNKEMVLLWDNGEVDVFMEQRDCGKY